VENLKTKNLAVFVKEDEKCFYVVPVEVGASLISIDQNKKPWGAKETGDIVELEVDENGLVEVRPVKFCLVCDTLQVGGEIRAGGYAKLSKLSCKNCGYGNTATSARGWEHKIGSVEIATTERGRYNRNLDFVAEIVKLMDWVNEERKKRNLPLYNSYEEFCIRRIPEGVTNGTV
jgi:hypothetical protein